MQNSYRMSSHGTDSRAVRAHGGMALWALIVGLSFPIVGHLSPELPPLTLTALRFLVATIAMLPFARGQGLTAPNWKAVVLYMLMGCSLAAFFSSMFWAAHRSSALTMSVLYVSVPVSAYSLGRLMRVERRDRALLGLLTLGAAGALLLARAEIGAGGFGLGWEEALFFLGCTASALYPVLSKVGLRKGWLPASPAVRTLWSLAFGCVLIGTLALAVEPVEHLARATTTDLLLITYLGVFSSGATFWLLQIGTNSLSPSVVTAYSYLVPIVSLLFLFFGGVALHLTSLAAGAGIVTAAIALLIARDARRAAASKYPENAAPARGSPCSTHPST